MAQTTTIYSNHSLDLSSLENLALDLSNRLKATIIYGYIDDYNETNRDEVTYDFVSLGRVLNESLGKSYKLIENNYIAKQLPHNETISYAPEDGIPLYELVTDETDFDNILNIFPEIIELNSIGFKNWNSYCGYFLYENSPINQEDFEKWRYQMRRHIYRLGGDSCFIVSDSNTVINESHSWQKAIDHVAKEYKYHLINIPQYFINEQLTNRLWWEHKGFSSKHLRKLNYAITKNIQYAKQTDLYPKIFYDDFKDLKHCRVTTEEFTGEEYEQCFKNFKIIDEISFVENIKIEREVIPLEVKENWFLVLETDVTALMHYCFTSIEFELKVNQEVFLEREPNNTFDKNAIAVYGSDSSGNLLKFGYILRWVNETLACYMDKGLKYKVFLTKIDDDKINKGGSFQDAVAIQVYDCNTP